MALASDIVRRALRLMGVLKAGKEPTGTDAEDGLERLQGMILALPGLSHNGRFCEHAESAAYTAKEGDRITCTGAIAITLPATVTDCDTGCARPPRDLAKVQIIGQDVDNAGLWLFSATKGAWGQADGLELSDELPFGEEDTEGLAALLAVDWADEYGADLVQIGPRTLVKAEIAARSFRARLKRAEPEDPTRPGAHRHRFSDYI